METISVIIPVYNAAATVAKCLDSLLAQTYPEVEIIAVNDGSSDDSAKICAQYASKYPNVIFLDKEKAGVSAARNYALDRCTGSWLSFIDSDDYVDPSFLQELHNAAVGDVKISMCGMTIEQEGKKRFYPEDLGNMETMKSSDAFLMLMRGDRIKGWLCNKLYHRSLFENERLDTKLPFMQDFEINLRVFYNSEYSVAFVNNYGYHYIKTKGSGSSKSTNRINGVERLHQLLDRYPDTTDKTYRYIKDYLKQLRIIALNDKKPLDDPIATRNCDYIKAHYKECEQWLSGSMLKQCKMIAMNKRLYFMYYKLKK